MPLQRGAVPSPVRVQLVHGDLLDQNVDVIVNAWNRNPFPHWLHRFRSIAFPLIRAGTFGVALTLVHSGRFQRSTIVVAETAQSDAATTG
jgi:O-acetyl-ADP-ribose deacetylase (regulator of RNase III)